MLTRANARLLFSGSTRKRFVVAVAASGAAALAEAAGVIAILPLMQLLTGSSSSAGLLGWTRDFLGAPDDARLALYLVLLTFCAFLVKGLASVTIRWWVLGFVFAQEAETSTRLLLHYLRAPYSAHLRRNSADMIRTMNDAVSQVYSQVVVGSMSAVAETLTILAIAGGLLFMMPAPTLGIAVYFLATGYSFHRINRRRAVTAGERMLQSYVDIYKGAYQALGGLKEIRVTHAEEHFLSHFRAARGRHAKARRVAVFLGELPKYVFELLFVVGIGSLTIWVFMTTASSAAITTLALFAAAGFRVLPSMVRLLASLHLIRVGSRALDLVVEDLSQASVYNEPNREGPAETESPIEHPLREVLIDDVSFRHAGSTENTLTNVTFAIPVGATVAVVGASGSGKSTLIDLILGVHQPTKGQICANGQPIQNDLPKWHARIGFVAQDVFLLDDSLQANIAFGVPADHVDLPRLHTAVARSELSDLVAVLPQGLDSHVGERGARLSGGQRQRLGIARALYRQPQFLILDEATSALDNETEHRINQTVAALRGHMTILVVAHRLSTVRNSDVVVFLQQGQVAAYGTFDELQARNSDFAHLASLGSLA